MVAWSTTDKSANCTLSGGNLTATFTSATQGSVRCDTSFSGKLYYEVFVPTSAAYTSFFSVGWANATAALATQIGTTVNSVAARPNRADVLFNNVSTPMRGGGSFNIPQTVRIAIDTGAKLFWVALGDDYWNASSTADPASGTGGISLATLGAGPYFPMFGSAASGTVCTALFGATDMNFTPPAGFSTLATNAQAFMGASKFEGYAIYQPPKAAVVVSKFEGYAIYQPPKAAVSCAKMIGYAILADTKPPPRSRTREAVYLRF